MSINKIDGLAEFTIAAYGAPMHPTLTHIDNWLFDLDLTLYAPEANIMAQIRDRIALYVQQHFSIDSPQAHAIRQKYYLQYGTTLGGLMAEDGVYPGDYLDFVHDVDFSALHPQPELASMIATLPGRKMIFTNADAPYAERILDRLGLSHCFEGIFDIHAMDYRPKPAKQSYIDVCEFFSIDPAHSLFIEDSAHNLAPAKEMGMTTVWINHRSEYDSREEKPHYIDIEIDRLDHWLNIITEKEDA
jgi:putative hydrolase of the HAD superfamily